MKNVLLIILAFFLIISVATPALAAEIEAPPNETVKILPDNPLYKIKTFWQSIKIAFTRDPIKNIERRLELANQQLSDTETLLEKRGDKVNTKTWEKIFTTYQKTVTRLTARAEKLSTEQRSTLLERVAPALVQQQATLAILKNKLRDTAPTELNPQILENLKQQIADSEQSPPATPAESGRDTQQRFLACMQKCLDAGGTAALCEPDCNKQAAVDPAVLKQLEWIESFRPEVKTPPIPPPPSDEELRRQDAYVEEFLSQPKIQDYLKNKANTAPAQP